MLTKVVPDLLFSEMRFLQKPEPSTKEESDQKPKKKPRKKKSEKEIARYFDVCGTRPADHEVNQKRHTPPLDASAVARDLQPASPVISGLIEKPFLGFGSRGTHPLTTSYYSWSESGRESSTRAKQFAPNLETLAAGQLQSSRLREQTRSIPLGHNPDQHTSVERAIVQSRSKSQRLKSEPAREIDQATRPPAKPPLVKDTSTEAMPVPIPEKHAKVVPTTTSLADQTHARSNSTENNLAVDETVQSPLKDDEHHGVGLLQPKPMSNPMARQYAEPWEELL
jgi:hypothetical protein